MQNRNQTNNTKHGTPKNKFQITEVKFETLFSLPLKNSELAKFQFDSAGDSNPKLLANYIYSVIILLFFV